MAEDDGERLPLKARLRDVDSPAKTMSPGFAVVFALNYMFGSGFLTLPRAFVDATVPVGVVLTLAITLGATASAECLLDVMARAGAPLHVPELCRKFLGVAGEHLYLFMLVGFMVGALWGYAAIFALSFEAHGFLPEMELTYEIYVLLFGCVVLPFACVDLADQKFSQALLAFGRTVMLVVMTTTAGVALFAQGPLHERTASSRPPFARVVAAAPVVAYACTLHHSVPQICGPVETSTFVLNYVFRVAFFLAAVFYVLFSTVIALFFGDLTKAAVNLDWADYHLTGVSPFVRSLGHVLAKFVVLYPAVNVVATYPLTAITLGDAFLDAFFSSSRRSRTHLVCCRLFAATPPLVGALCVSDISAITRFTGVFGLAMCGVYPGLLALAARRAVPEPTPNTSALNGPLASLTLVVVGAVLCLTPLLDALNAAIAASWAAEDAPNSSSGLRHRDTSFPY
mmetsp:Transcript_829/g.2343  ORF Transcript_829/g.2343 Transcript_829/m.2343 type:complete len:455 (+) Transcript_829:63-1427(+)